MIHSFIHSLQVTIKTNLTHQIPRFLYFILDNNPFVRKRRLVFQEPAVEDPSGKCVEGSVGRSWTRQSPNMRPSEASENISEASRGFRLFQ